MFHFLHTFAKLYLLSLLFEYQENVFQVKFAFWLYEPFHKAK